MLSALIIRTSYNITVLSASQKSAVSGLSQIGVLTKSVFSEVNNPFEFDEEIFEAVIIA